MKQPRACPKCGARLSAYQRLCCSCRLRRDLELARRRKRKPRNCKDCGVPVGAVSRRCFRCQAQHEFDRDVARRPRYCKEPGCWEVMNGSRKARCFDHEIDHKNRLREARNARRRRKPR